MKVRRAQGKDIRKIDTLLSEVLEIHAQARPDLFISGTRKYTEEELTSILENDSTPVFAAVDEDDRLVGYAFCQIEEPVISNNMIPRKCIYIDDLCVEEGHRGEHIGHQLLEYVKQYAKDIGCYHITLNVWKGNDSAEAFYKKEGMTVQKTKLEYIL